MLCQLPKNWQKSEMKCVENSKSFRIQPWSCMITWLWNYKCWKKKIIHCVEKILPMKITSKLFDYVHYQFYGTLMIWVRLGVTQTLIFFSILATNLQLLMLVLHYMKNGNSIIDPGFPPIYLILKINWLLPKKIGGDHVFPQIILVVLLYQSMVKA